MGAGGRRRAEALQAAREAVEPQRTQRAQRTERHGNGVPWEEETPCLPLRSLRPLRFKVVELPPDGPPAAGRGTPPQGASRV